MDLGLTGRTAIVCGASSGMGLGIAESLREEGANVVMFARRRELLEREAERIGATAVTGDVTIASDLELLVQTAVETYGGVDILVNNSGGPPRATARALDAERVEEAVGLLLVSVVRLTSLCLPYLEKSGRGRIVNITSQHGARADREPRAFERRPTRRHRLGQVARARARTAGNHRQLDRTREHRHGPDSRAPPRRPVRRRPPGDPDCADSARHARSATSSPSSARTGRRTSAAAVIFVDGAASRSL